MKEPKDGAENGANDAAAGTGAEAVRAEPSLEEQLALMQAEASDLKDRMLRALAEAENVRRRSLKERDDAGKYAIASFAKDLLDAVDNLRRALDSAPKEQIKDEFTRTLLDGVAATERAFLAALERHGIRRIEPNGERFDHNLHQAVFEAPGTGKPAGTVIEVLQPGYVLHDRLLRPAMVGVAKGEAKPAEGADDAG